MPITPHANGKFLLKAELLSFPVCILLVVWSAYGDGSIRITSKASSNLLNDDTYQCVCSGNCVRPIEQGAHYIRKSLIYLMRIVFLEKAAVEIVYKFDEKFYRECLRNESITNVRFNFIFGPQTYIIYIFITYFPRSL